ncbi:MAG: DUF4147 domain-containing protein [Methylococcaceae bacterium]
MNNLHQHAINIFQAGIHAANPYYAVQQYIKLNNNTIELGHDDTHKRTGDWSTIHLIAFGKAALSMITAAQDIIPKHLLINKPIVVTNYENVSAENTLEIIGAGHPLPDNNGLQAAQKIAKEVIQARQGELVLVLISGGGSALIPYPVNSISLQEKIITTQLLLASGASINEINCVRKHLSQLKGGGLAKLAYPADVHALILSDVLGDEVSAIASGTTVADNSTFSDAICVLKTKGLWHNVPLSVRSYLQDGEQGLVAETPKASDPVFANTDYHLIGSNTLSVNAMRDAAELAGFAVEVIDYALCGEAKQAAETLVAIAKTRCEQGINKPLALLAGGETTVTLTGTGLGGRNQEMSLAFAIAAQKQALTGNWLFLSGGTDGRDGPTDAAGGIIDNNSLSLINNAEQLLLNNDSYHALKQANALLITGATGTNVADLQILLLLPN